MDKQTLLAQQAEIMAELAAIEKAEKEEALKAVLPAFRELFEGLIFELADSGVTPESLKEKLPKIRSLFFKGDIKSFGDLPKFKIIEEMIKVYPPKKKTNLGDDAEIGRVTLQVLVAKGLAQSKGQPFATHEEIAAIIGSTPASVSWYSSMYKTAIIEAINTLKKEVETKNLG